MPVSKPWFRLGGTLVVSLATAASGRAQEVLDVDRYVEIVLRAHPAASQAAGLEQSAQAERRAARQWPDPVFEYTRSRATPAEPHAASATETGYSLSQTLPWPGTRGAGKTAADRHADALRAGASSIRWELAAQARQAFARLEAARALHDVARAAESDARSLRDLVTRRAQLGESRESDRIKASVEWLRQARTLAAAEREAEAAEAILRALAVEGLPEPLALRRFAPPPLPRLDHAALAARVLAINPRLVAAQADAARLEAALSQARRARIPDLAVTLFKQRELDKDATGFALGVTLPLWNGNRGEIARADAASRTGAAEAGRARIDLTTELQARLKELQIAGDQAALLEHEILPAALRSVELVRLSFEEGEASLLDLLDAQRTLRDTQREAAEAHLALGLALAEIQRLAGPDFNPWS